MTISASLTVLLLLALTTNVISQTTTHYICPSGYFFDLQHCQTCSSNCDCSTMNTCTSCIAGYTMYNGLCIQCPQSSGIYGTCSSCCSKTDGTQLSCTDCAVVANSFTFLYSGRCIVSPGCFEINSQGFCLQCFPGYYEHNNLCYTCDTSCATCSDSTNCLTCASGYYWGIVNGGLCKACPTGCSTCDSSAVCYSCLVDYYLFQSNCIACPTYCSSCSDGSTCTSCSQGILVSNVCVICTDTTYQGSSGCTSCLASNNFISCTQCADTYFLDSNGVCQLCSSFITGSIRCSNQNTPTQCLYDYNTTLTERYYLVGITCIQNSKSCRKISDVFGNCSQCYDGYTISAGACTPCVFTGCKVPNSTVLVNVCTCTECASGYYLSGITCAVCSAASCALCPADSCTSCVPNFFLSGSSCLPSTAANCLVASSATLCTTCNDGFYLGSDFMCYSCQANCLKCTDRYTCTLCNQAINYYLHSSNTCLAMPLNCVALSTDYSCKLCTYGHYLSNGYCIACNVELATLNKCQGLCPIDYYIQSLVISWQSYLLITSVLLLTILI